MNSPTLLSGSNIGHLNPYLRINSQTEAQKLEKEALAWHILAMISTVAFIAIMGVALASAYGLATIPVTILAPLILSTFPLNWSLMNCFARYRQTSERAEIERGVAQQHTLIQQWDVTKKVNFFKTHQIVFAEDSDSSDLLQGIARYQYYKELGGKIIKEAQLTLAINIEGSAQEDACYLHAFQQLERQGFPSILKAAHMLQILRNPSSTINLEEDRLVLKSFEQRMLHRHLRQPFNDDYVKLDERPITFQEIYDDPNPVALRARLFPDRSSEPNGVVVM